MEAGTAEAERVGVIETGCEVWLGAAGRVQSLLAAHPTPIAATRLAAQAPTCSRRRRTLAARAARAWSVSKAGGNPRGGASLASKAVVRSRRAAIPSRAPWQEEQVARWLSISTHCER